MKVLAIGATGFIGRHVIPRLVEQGNEVAVLHRGGTGADRLTGVRHICGNRNRLEDVSVELERFAPDVVLDAIHYTEQQARKVIEAFRGNTSPAAIALAVADPRTDSRVYNVGDEPALSERSWVERIGAAVGWEGEVVAVSSSELPRNLRHPFDWRYELWTDTSKIREELGHVEPIPLDEALERAIEWERSTLDDVEPLDYLEEDAILRSKLHE